MWKDAVDSGGGETTLKSEKEKLPSAETWGAFLLCFQAAPDARYLSRGGGCFDEVMGVVKGAGENELLHGKLHHCQENSVQSLIWGSLSYCATCLPVAVYGIVEGRSVQTGPRRMMLWLQSDTRTEVAQHPSPVMSSDQIGRLSGLDNPPFPWKLFAPYEEEALSVARCSCH